GKRRAKRFGTAADARDCLTIGLFDIVFQRHGRGANVSALPHRILGALTAKFGQHEAIADAANEIAPLDLDALFILEELERFLDDLERQANAAGQIESEHHPLDIESAHQQVVEE